MKSENRPTSLPSHHDLTNGTVPAAEAKKRATCASRPFQRRAQHLRLLRLRPGRSPIYAEAARTLGRSLAENDIALVYGGGGLGLMGEVARSTLEAGGKVTGIIPDFLTVREHMLKEVTDLVVTADMHERKKLMFERSDAFVALPGGIGTLEELVEQMTWAQLGQHKKPIIVANIGGFWTPFLNLLTHMQGEAFIRAGLEVPFSVVAEAEDIVPRVQEIAAKLTGEKEPAALIKF